MRRHPNTNSFEDILRVKYLQMISGMDIKTKYNHKYKPMDHTHETVQPQETPVTYWKTIRIELTDAPWASKLIKVSPNGTQNVYNLIDLLYKLEEDKAIRTIHIHIHEDCLVDVFPYVKKLVYIFRAYDNNSYQYYKWLLSDVEDKVHPYATSTAGATTMILSPDEQSILLVNESNMWKPVTGSNSLKELSLHTALREASEEVGIEMDPSFEPRVIGLWNVGGRCGKKLNDVMTCYIIKSSSLEYKLDEFEVSVAKWFKIEDLKNVISMAKNKENRTGQYAFWSHVTDEAGNNFGYPYMLWLGNYLEGRWFNNHIEDDNVNFIY